MIGLLAPSPRGSVQLKRPQEVGGVLEVGSHGEDLVDEILHADDAEASQIGLDQVVGGDGRALAVDLHEAALVDQLAD